MVWLGRGPLQRLRRMHTASLVIYVLFSIIVYNEFLDYFLQKLWWEELPNPRPRGDNVKILFVADPQLIGLHNENPYVGPFSRWDNDRYLSRTFHMAYSAVEPDVVVFMGDLFDEGSTSRGAEYASYHRRFMETFRVKNTTQRLYLAGDNDVGGEALDAREPWKVAQFEKYFNKETGVKPVKFVDLIYMNYQQGNTYDKRTEDMVESLKSRSRGKVRILLNHMGILRRHYQSYDKMLSTLKPSLIFSAHNHRAFMVTCPRCQQEEPSIAMDMSRMKLISSSSVFSFPFNHPTDYNELVVPTCSYRMGVERMGFGAASIVADGTIHYTVLWIPSRYSQLYLYVVVPLGLFLLLLFVFIVETCIAYRQEFCNLSEEELHKRNPDLPNFTGCLGYAMRAIHFSLFSWYRLRRSRRR